MEKDLLTRTQGGLEAGRRAPSVLDRLAQGQSRFLRLAARHGVEVSDGSVVTRLKAAGIAQAESGALSLVLGYLAARSPEYLKVGPLPLELVVGVGSHAIGLIASPHAATHLHAVGMGAIDSFMNSLGRGLGRRARKAAGLPPPPETLLAGDAGEVTGGGALSDEELASLARRI
ncbi:MAG: hypothetical protein SFX73_08465 [Kofleriaceae bacterium]|nr:hypothetical protein [Kofleriaceae bacterium]